MSRSTPNALSEFELIAQYFSRPASEGVIGVGDDCGIFSVRPGFQLAVSTDTLIQGQHFFADTDPERLGHKALAVNLSDLAAVGAVPRACLLALALPTPDQQWLKSFSRGFHALAEATDCPLIGGDTTKNPSGVMMTVTVLGEVPVAQALLRNRARPEDDIWVTGHLGAPFLALQMISGHWPSEQQVLALARPRLEQPQPPVLWATELPGQAHAAIDISDGLVQDLTHILTASQCGARLYSRLLPQHPALKDQPRAHQYQALLAGGDEFELCFTAPKQARAFILDSARKAQVTVTRIGQITEDPGLSIFDFDDQPLEITTAGFDHFR